MRYVAVDELTTSVKSRRDVRERDGRCDDLQRVAAKKPADARARHAEPSIQMPAANVQCMRKPFEENGYAHIHH